VTSISSNSIRRADSINSRPQTRPTQKQKEQPESHGDTFTLQLLHTTDMHGSALPVQRRIKNGAATVKVKRGGLDKVAQLATDLRGEYPNTIFVDSGDTVSGQVTTDVNQGRSMTNMMSRMDYTAVTLGNHEFDFGPDVMRERIKNAEYPTVIANVRDADGTQLDNTLTSTVVEFDQGRVGIIGLLTDDMPDIATEQNIKDFIFDDPIKTLRRELPKLREQDVDSIVVLTHQDDDDDRKLAAAFPGEGLIIPGGHSHREYPTIENINGNFLFKSGTQGAAMGQMIATINTKTNRPESVEFHMIPVSDDLSSDEEIKSMVEECKAKSDETMGIVVGQLDSPLTLDARQDSDLGNVITDAMRSYHGTDIGFMNTDGIRKPLASGPLTAGDLHEVFPFQGSEAVKGNLTGEQLLRTLETSIGHSDTDGKSSFLQVSGLTFSYDQEGIQNLKINGEDCQAEKTYSVACYNYLTTGKLGYNALAEGEWFNGGIPLTTMLKDYVTALDQSTLDATGTRIQAP
jgi:5'-nucleotidase/UDP-sugar diphosphatase